MEDDLRGALLIDTFPEIMRSHFDNEIFSNITLAPASSGERALDIGYLNNMATRMYRLSQVSDLLKGKETEDFYCEFVHEIFLNQALAVTDSVASMMNHFLKLGLRKNQIAIHNERFKIAIEKTFEHYNYLNDLQEVIQWVTTKLYPYRNLIHHHALGSSIVSLNGEFWVMNDEEIDMIDLKSKMIGFPSHTAFQNSEGVFSKHLGHRYYRCYVPLTQFMEQQIFPVVSVVIYFVKALVWNQQLNSKAPV